MKRKAQSACVEDVDSETEEVIPETQTRASISPPEHESRARRKSWRKSGQKLQESQDSTYLGSILDVITQNSLGGDNLTFIAGKYDDNEIEELSQRSSDQEIRNHRVFYLEDEIINTDSGTQISRCLLVDPASDLDATNPSLILAQRTYSPDGKLHLKAHRLFFGPKLDVNRLYVFAGLGDELPGVAAAAAAAAGRPRHGSADHAPACPDLLLSFRPVRHWDTVLQRATTFASPAHKFTIPVSRREIQDPKKRLVYDFEAGRMVDEDEGLKPKFGISVAARDLRPLLELGNGPGLSNGNSGRDSYPNPRPSKRKPMLDVDEERSRGGEEGKGEGEKRVFEIKLIGLSKEIKGRPFRADVDVKFVLKE